MTDIRTAPIPFSGFYESAHDIALDSALESMFSDDSDELLLPDAWESVDWRAAHLAYAQEYTKRLADECNATWQFAAMDSPREYNFRTDEIDVTLTLAELQRMLDHVPRETLRARVADRCTSYDGFISFYSNELETWGALETWESPQLGILLECYCDEFTSAESREWEIIDDCNGEITAMIESAIPDETLRAMYDECDKLRGIDA